MTGLTVRKRLYVALLTVGLLAVAAAAAALVAQNARVYSASPPPLVPSHTLRDVGCLRVRNLGSRRVHEYGNLRRLVSFPSDPDRVLAVSGGGHLRMFIGVSWSATAAPCH